MKHPCCTIGVAVKNRAAPNASPDERNQPMALRGPPPNHSGRGDRRLRRRRGHDRRRRWHDPDARDRRRPVGAGTRRMLTRAGLAGISREGGDVVIGAATPVAALTGADEPLANGGPRGRPGGSRPGNRRRQPLCSTRPRDVRAEISRRRSSHSTRECARQARAVSTSTRSRAVPRGRGGGGDSSSTSGTRDVAAGEPGLASVRRPHTHHTYTIMGRLRGAIGGGEYGWPRAASARWPCACAPSRRLAAGEPGSIAAHKSLDDVDPPDDALASAWYRGERSQPSSPVPWLTSRRRLMRADRERGRARGREPAALVAPRTSSARSSGSRARRPAASRAAAAPAPSSSTARRGARASFRLPPVDGARDHDRRGARIAGRAWARPGGIPRCVRSAVRLLHERDDDRRARRSCGRTRPRAARTSNGRSPATSAAAPATSRSSKQSSWRRRDRCGMKAVGARLPRYDGIGHVTGQTRYVDDVRVPGILWTKALRSPIHRGDITRLDTSEGASPSRRPCHRHARGRPEERLRPPRGARHPGRRAAPRRERGALERAGHRRRRGRRRGHGAGGRRPDRGRARGDRAAVRHPQGVRPGRPADPPMGATGINPLRGRDGPPPDS